MAQTYNVIRATHVKDYILEVTFNDGTASQIDFSQFFFGPIFEPLRDVNYFKKFFLEGWTVAWPNGADIAPETLYEIASKQALKSPSTMPHN